MRHRVFEYYGQGTLCDSGIELQFPVFLLVPRSHLESFLPPSLLITLAEIGDKTQLLSFLLAAKPRRSYLIMIDIIATTV